MPSAGYAPMYVHGPGGRPVYMGRPVASPPTFGRTTMPPPPPPMRLSEAEEMMKISSRKKKRIPRPMNSFMIFGKEQRKLIQQQHPDLDNKSVSKLLGQRWASLPDSQKQVYVDKAKEMAEEHRRLYPDWKFTRDTSKNKKSRSKLKQSVSQHSVDGDHDHDEAGTNTEADHANEGQQQHLAPTNGSAASQHPDPNSSSAPNPQHLYPQVQFAPPPPSSHLPPPTSQSASRAAGTSAPPPYNEAINMYQLNPQQDGGPPTTSGPSSHLSLSSHNASAGAAVPGHHQPPYSTRPSPKPENVAAASAPPAYGTAHRTLGARGPASSTTSSTATAFDQHSTATSQAPANSPPSYAAPPAFSLAKRISEAEFHSLVRPSN